MTRDDILEIVAREWETCSEAEALRARISCMFADDDNDTRELAREIVDQWLEVVEEIS